MTRKERLKRSTDMLLVATNLLDLVSAELQFLADRIGTPTESITSHQRDKFMSMVRQHVVLFAITLSGAERVFRSCGGDLPDTKQLLLEADIRTLKAKVVLHLDQMKPGASHQTKQSLTHIRILISDLYSNWQMYFGKLDDASPLRPPSASNPELKKSTEQTANPDASGIVPHGMTTNDRNQWFQRHGATIVIHDTDIELTEQLADLLEGVLSRADGLSLDDARKLLCLETEPYAGIHTRLSNLRKKIKFATKNATFILSIWCKDKIIRYTFVMNNSPKKLCKRSRASAS